MSVFIDGCEKSTYLILCVFNVCERALVLVCACMQELVCVCVLLVLTWLKQVAIRLGTTWDGKC